MGRGKIKRNSMYQTLYKFWKHKCRTIHSDILSAAPAIPVKLFERDQAGEIFGLWDLQKHPCDTQWSNHYSMGRTCEVWFWVFHDQFEFLSMGRLEIGWNNISGRKQLCFPAIVALESTWHLEWPACLDSRHICLLFCFKILVVL